MCSLNGKTSTEWIIKEESIFNIPLLLQEEIDRTRKDFKKREKQTHMRISCSPFGKLQSAYCTVTSNNCAQFVPMATVRIKVQTAISLKVCEREKRPSTLLYWYTREEGQGMMVARRQEPPLLATFFLVVNEHIQLVQVRHYHFFRYYFFWFDYFEKLLILHNSNFVLNRVSRKCCSKLYGGMIAERTGLYLTSGTSV